MALYACRIRPCQRLIGRIVEMRIKLREKVERKSMKPDEKANLEETRDFFT
jgi:hypothetical protein